jgi:hypothetical protein
MKTTNTENKSNPNIKYVVDSKGKGWICDITASDSDDLRGQGCVPAEEWHYDRMFGG